MTTHDAPPNPYAVFQAEMAKYRTAEEFAHAIGLSPAYVSQITNHAKPIPERTLEKLGIVRIVRITYEWIDSPPTE